MWRLFIIIIIIIDIIVVVVAAAVIIFIVYSSSVIMKTRLVKYIENLNIKNRKFSDKKKNSDIFNTSAQNTD